MSKNTYKKMVYLQTFFKTLTKLEYNTLLSNLNTLNLYELNSFLPIAKSSKIIKMRKVGYIHENNLIDILVTNGSGIGIKTLDAIFNYRKNADYYYYDKESDSTLLQWFYKYNKNHLLEIYGIGPAKADIIMTKINNNCFNLEEPLQSQLEKCKTIGKKCAFRIIHHF